MFSSSQDVDETGLTKDEKNERLIMALLLKVKNGTPQMRKVCVCVSLSLFIFCLFLLKDGNFYVLVDFFVCFGIQAALKQLTTEARIFGAGPLFNQILPILMMPTLEDQVRIFFDFFEEFRENVFFFLLKMSGSVRLELDWCWFDII